MSEFDDSDAARSVEPNPRQERGFLAALAIGIGAAFAALVATVLVVVLTGGVAQLRFVPLVLFVLSVAGSAAAATRSRPSSWILLSAAIACIWLVFFLFVLPLGGAEVRTPQITLAAVVFSSGSAVAGGRFGARRRAA